MASTKSQSVFLSPLDQYMPRTNTSIILLFETANPTKAVDNLKAGLQRLNQRLPYLKGRVFATEADTASRGRLAIKWSAADKDIELTEMRAEGLEAENIIFPGIDFKNFREEGAPLHYFPRCIMPLPAVTDLQSSPDAPVFAVNYTVMDGGLALGLCVQHGVMDGTGVVELVRFWAECTRSDDLSTISAPNGEEPLHRDRLLRLATQQAGTAEDDAASPHVRRPFRELLNSHPEFRLSSELRATAGPPAPPPSSPMGACKLFAFDGSKLDAVKTALRASRAASLQKEWVTTNSVLCAIMWSCVTRVRAARREGQGGLGAPISKLGFAVNGRTRLHPGSALAERPFLGNVNLFGMVEMAVSAVGKAGVECRAAIDDEASGLARVVGEIAKAIKRVTPGYVAEVMDLIDQAPDLTDVRPGWDSFHNADLTITSWANMGLYDADFGDGVGKPELMRVPWMMVDGLLIVLPRKRGLVEQRLNDGTNVAAVESLEVIVVLHPEDIAALEKDSIWTSYLI
ncbi:Trichothecene 3-O-acetyltransferase [Madurella fahalii]|uniref:Trichothecene 3-O-acetyltransferase n=1 Tax=Madurella fahalii TaxID=1157608 RepID=A0ABQ0G9L3_9PEZI